MATIEERGDGRSKTYRVKVRRKGYPLKTKTFDRYADAKRWAHEVEHQIDSGSAVWEKEAERTTLGEALTRYAEEVTPTKKSARQETNRINQLKRDLLAKRSLASIRGVDLSAYRNKRLQDVSASTVRLDLALISNLYTVCRQEWGMESLKNPVEFTKKPKPPEGRDRRLESDEEEKLLKAAAQDRCPWIKPLIVTAIDTAARQGEMLKASRKDIDLQRARATWRKTKNGETRTVPLSERAIAELKKLPASVDGRMFPTTQSIVEKAFTRVCVAAGIKDLHFHDLRHEATSRLFEDGLDIMEVRQITGHKTLQMLLRYTHLRADRVAEKLRKARQQAVAPTPVA